MNKLYQTNNNFASGRGELYASSSNEQIHHICNLIDDKLLQFTPMT